MKFLCDENIELRIAQWLRLQGHDVFHVIESARGSTDEVLLRDAATEGRIVVTQDTDFGLLVTLSGRSAAGIILIRIKSAGPGELLRVLQQHWPQVEQAAEGSLVVITPTKVRVRSLDQVS